MGFTISKGRIECCNKVHSSHNFLVRLSPKLTYWKLLEAAMLLCPSRSTTRRGRKASSLYGSLLFLAAFAGVGLVSATPATPESFAGEQSTEKDPSAVVRFLRGVTGDHKTTSATDELYHHESAHTDSNPIGTTIASIQSVSYSMLTNYLALRKPQ